MKWLSRSLFTSPICYALCLSEKEFVKTLRKTGITNEDFPKGGARIHMFERDEGSFAIISLAASHESLPIQQVNALLAHEAMHLVDYIMEAIGEETPSSEFKAYMIQHICLALFESYLIQSKRET